MTEPEATPRCLDASRAAWEEARTVLFEGTGTYAKLPGVGVSGAAPLFAAKASGHWLWDADGNRYLDLAAGVGAVVLGHASPRVVRAIVEQASLGSQFSINSLIELDVARRIRALSPIAGRVRFFKTGADAVSAGVRIARAATGRDLILRGPYHGWHDWAMAGTPRGAGIPAAAASRVIAVPRHDAALFRRAASEAAAPVAAICCDPAFSEGDAPGFLPALRALADELGALLLVDEIATGFRAAPAGVAAAEGVRPDLLTFGKALANGLPLGVLVGREEILDRVADRVFISSTFAGEALSLAAASAVLEELATTDARARLHAAGRWLRAELVEAAGDLGGGHSLSTSGFPWRFSVDVTGPDSHHANLVKSLFFQEMARRGVLLARTSYPMSAWDDEAAQVFSGAARSSAEVVRAAIASDSVARRLEGVALRSVPVF